MRIIGAVLLLSVCIAIGWRFYSTQNANNQRPESATAVVLHSVQQQKVTQALEAIGTAKAIESIEVMSTITERITSLPMQEGANVKKGSVLVELEKAEEQALLKSAKINLKEQEREYRRIEDLVRTKTVPSSELDKLQSLIDNAKARIAEVNAMLAERTLIAPFNGVVGLRNLSAGALARPGDTITTLDAIESLHIDFFIPEKHLGLLKIGNSVNTQSAAYPGQNFTGIISTLDTRVDPINRSIKVRATINNQDLKLRPGMLLTLRIVNDVRQLVMVPEEAVFMRGEQHFVFSVDAQNVVAETQVSIGLRQKGAVEITQGLNLGDNIVLQGVLKVRPGSKVKPQQETWRDEASSATVNPPSANANTLIRNANQPSGNA